MSRSYRQSPVVGWTTCESEKREKQAYNRRLRCAVRRKLKNCAQLTELVEDLHLPQVRDISDAHRFGKDGTVRLDPSDENFKRLMRK